MLLDIFSHFLSLSALSYYLSRSDHSKITVLASSEVSLSTLTGDTGHWKSHLLSLMCLPACVFITFSFASILAQSL